MYNFMYWCGIVTLRKWCQITSFDDISKESEKCWFEDVTLKGIRTNCYLGANTPNNIKNN